MVIPAIIPKSLDDLKTKLELLSFAKALQIDLVDGKFVSNSSWPYQPSGNVEEIAPFLTKNEIEVDLMVSDPMQAVTDWIQTGAKRIVFHIESLSGNISVLPIFLTEKKGSLLFGLAINNDTPLEQLYSFMDQIDFVQLMGIASIGKQGEPFDNRVIDRVTTIRSLYPNLEISIDGAVDQTNISALKNAGANRFVVGSAILNSNDPQAVYNELLKIATS